MSKYARRVDNNHAEIRDSLRELGFWVKDISRAGMGLPDLFVEKSGFRIFVEIKSPGGKVTPEERELLAYMGDWALIAYNLDEVIEAYNLWVQRA